MIAINPREWRQCSGTNPWWPIERSEHKFTYSSRGRIALQGWGEGGEAWHWKQPLRANGVVWTCAWSRVASTSLSVFPPPYFISFTFFRSYVTSGQYFRCRLDLFSYPWHLAFKTTLSSPCFRLLNFNFIRINRIFFIVYFFVSLCFLVSKNLS